MGERGVRFSAFQQHLPGGPVARKVRLQLRARVVGEARVEQNLGGDDLRARHASGVVVAVNQRVAQAIQ